MGRNTTTLVKVEADKAKAICLLPITDASYGEYPSCWLKRYMFSKATIELSTSIPTANVKADRVIRLSDISAKFIRANVANIDVGIEIAIIRVEFIYFKNKNITIIA